MVSAGILCLFVELFVQPSCAVINDDAQHRTDNTHGRREHTCNTRDLSHNAEIEAKTVGEMTDNADKQARKNRRDRKDPE